MKKGLKLPPFKAPDVPGVWRVGDWSGRARLRVGDRPLPPVHASCCPTGRCPLLGSLFPPAPGHVPPPMRTLKSESLKMEWTFPCHSIGERGKRDTKPSRELAFNAVSEQCYDGVFFFVNKSGVVRALCGADIAVIHKGAYCDRVMESSWSDTGTSRSVAPRKQPGLAPRHLPTKHKPCLDILFSFHFSRLCSFPVAACADLLLSRSSRQFLLLHNIGGLLCHCEELRERSACQAARIIRISGGKLGETAVHTHTHTPTHTYSFSAAVIRRSCRDSQCKQGAKPRAPGDCG